MQHLNPQQNDSKSESKYTTLAKNFKIMWKCFCWIFNFMLHWHHKYWS